jgi:hypothetical protein
VHPSYSESTLYQPPKSQGFGHAATPRNPLAAWQVLESFIKVHAITNEWFPTMLTIDARPEFWTPSSLQGVLATLTELEEKPDLIPAGTYRSRPSNTLTWFEKPNQRKPLSSQTLMAVIDVASRLPKSNIKWCYAIQLHFGFDFFWRGRSELQTPPVRSVRNLDDKPDWGPANAYSSLGISIRDHLFVQPFFLLPCEWGNSALTNLLADISPQLPFKLRPNYFRRAVVNKRGDAFKLLRIAPKTTQPMRTELRSSYFSHSHYRQSHDRWVF